MKKECHISDTLLESPSVLFSVATLYRGQGGLSRKIFSVVRIFPEKTTKSEKEKGYACDSRFPVIKNIETGRDKHDHIVYLDIRTQGTGK